MSTGRARALAACRRRDEGSGTYGGDRGTDEEQGKQAHETDKLARKGRDAAVVVAPVDDVDTAPRGQHHRPTQHRPHIARCAPCALRHR